MFDTSMQGAVQVVSCSSPLNSENFEEFEELFSGLLSEGQPMTVFDMSAVPLMDSQGLETLLLIQEKYCRRGGDLKLSGLTPLCSDIMHVTGIGRHFSIFDKLIDALGSFTR